MLNTSVATLFHEVERLDAPTLDNFISNVLSLRMHRETSDKQKEEAVLLKKINKSLSIDEISQFRILNEKRKEDEITEVEYANLVILLEKIEKLNVSRLKYLTSLAQLRNISVRELIQQLGISTSKYA
ncbi:MAG: hypothetical protein RLZZ292_1208 [Bacteroidota bacterium]|jgi:hypothetical protein